MTDISVTAASVLASAQAVIRTMTAGATITAGMSIYEDASDSYSAKPADADASSAASHAIGIALNGAADGQPVRVCTYDPDFTPGATLSLSGAGDDGIYVVSGTAGGICPVTDLAAADYPCVLMVAKSTTKAVLNPTWGGGVLV